MAQFSFSSVSTTGTSANSISDARSHSPTSSDHKCRTSPERRRNSPTSGSGAAQVPTAVKPETGEEAGFSAVDLDFQHGETDSPVRKAWLRSCQLANLIGVFGDRRAVPKHELRRVLLRLEELPPRFAEKHAPLVFRHLDVRDIRVFFCELVPDLPRDVIARDNSPQGNLDSRARRKREVDEGVMHPILEFSVIAFSGEGILHRVEFGGGAVLDGLVGGMNRINSTAKQSGAKHSELRLYLNGESVYCEEEDDFPVRHPSVKLRPRRDSVTSVTARQSTSRFNYRILSGCPFAYPHSQDNLLQAELFEQEKFGLSL